MWLPHSPVASARDKHLVEGELPMEIPLDHVQPLRLPREEIQLLGRREVRVSSTSRAPAPLPSPGCPAHTHVKLADVLLQLDLAAGEVLPGSAPQRGRDPLLAPQTDLQERGGTKPSGDITEH